MLATCRRQSTFCIPGEWTFRPVSKPRRARKMRRRSARLSRQCALQMRATDHGDSERYKTRRHDTEEARRSARAFRRLWWPLCSGNAHGRARRVGARVREGKERQKVSAATGLPAQTIRRTPDAAVLRAATHREAGWSEDLSQARRPSAYW